MTRKNDIPNWIPEGKVRDCLKGHGNLLGMLPNKLGDLSLVTVEIDDQDRVIFGQQNADGEGNAITAPLAGPDHIKQIQDGLKKVVSGQYV